VDIFDCISASSDTGSDVDCIMESA
jgi:hypothetical protein